MAYSELIKNFENVRDYMRQFFVYGFKTRTEYDKKSARSYDNERRRIESWLGDYMAFKQDSNGKNVFISVDSRIVPSNPLYNAFKAKSFTAGDITFHFYIMDILSDGRALSVNEIVEEANENYLYYFDNDVVLDESSVRKKLKEYTELGLLVCEKDGRELKYSRAIDTIDLKSWSEALAFYSETNPLGIIGSNLQDKLDSQNDFFRFKHQYLLHALDSDVLCSLFIAIQEKRSISISIVSRRSPNEAKIHNILPIKVFISTQTGRQYLLGYDYKYQQFAFTRIDNIHNIEIEDIENNYAEIVDEYESFQKYLWGVSSSSQEDVDHLEMTILINPGEEYILERLGREKRNGKVEAIDNNRWVYTVDCYDAMELIPWIRTFTGKIENLVCTNKTVEETFYSDFSAMAEMYGGNFNAV